MTVRSRKRLASKKTVKKRRRTTKKSLRVKRRGTVKRGGFSNNALEQLNDPAKLTELADGLSKKGNIVRAIAAYKKALEIKPNFEPAKTGYAELKEDKLYKYYINLHRPGNKNNGNKNKNNGNKNKNNGN